MTGTDRTDLARRVSDSRHASIGWDGEVQCAHCGRSLPDAETIQAVHGHLSSCPDYGAFESSGFVPASSKRDDERTVHYGNTLSPVVTTDERRSSEDEDNPPAIKRLCDGLVGLLSFGSSDTDRSNPSERDAWIQDSTAEGRTTGGTAGGSTDPDRSIGRLPDDALRKVRSLWDDRNERIAFALGAFLIGVAACDEQFRMVVLGVGLLYLGADATKETRLASDRLATIPFLDLTPTESVSIIRSQALQFAVGAALGFAVTSTDVLQTLGVNTCRLIRIGALA
jgi:hypothetical protein